MRQLPWCVAPPLQVQHRRDLARRQTPSLDHRRIARNHGVSRNILGNHGMGTHYRPIADGHARHNIGPVPDPDIIADPGDPGLRGGGLRN